MSEERSVAHQIEAIDAKVDDLTKKQAQQVKKLREEVQNLTTIISELANSVKNHREAKVEETREADIGEEHYVTGDEEAHENDEVEAMGAAVGKNLLSRNQDRTKQRQNRNSALRSRSFDETGVYAEALKTAVLMLPLAPQTDSIGKWVEVSVRRVSEAFPELTNKQVFWVVASRLSQDTVELITESLELDMDVEEFCTLVKRVVASMATDPDEAVSRFHEYHPRDKTIWGALKEIQAASYGLDLCTSRRHMAVAKKLCRHFPSPLKMITEEKLRFYEKELKSKATTKPKNVYDLLQSVLDDRDAIKEVEQFWASKRTVNQVSSKPKGQVNSAERKPRREWAKRCRRCGSTEHDEDQCVMYTFTVPTACPYCESYLRIKQYHSENECIIKAKTDPKSKN